MAAKLSIDEINEAIGADSIDYLTLENLTKVLGSEDFCLGCFA